MAIIQMVNEEVHDVEVSGDDLSNILSRGRPSPMIELQLKGDEETKIWINAAQISSFM